MRVDARLGSAARHQALHRGAVGGDRRARPARRRRPRRRATCASPWAASRPSSRWTTATAPSGTPRRWARPSAGSAPTCWTSCKRNTRRERPAPLRPGQVVSRASSCRAGRCPASGARTASRSGTTRRCSPTSARTTAPPKRRRRAVPARAGAASSALDPQYVFPAYEDTWYYLWRERKLPTNVDPFDARLDDPLERDAPAQDLRARASTRRPATCCRSRATSDGRAGRPGRWFLRDERCYLIPGDSPLGLRLPLDSLPWAADDRPAVGARAGSVRRSLHALPRRNEILARSDVEKTVRKQPLRRQQRAPAPFESAAWITRTAICAEPRNGVLYIFMPPAERARGLPRAGRRGRSHRRRAAHAGDPRRLRAAARPAPGGAAHHARPGRARGQHPPGARLGASWSRTPPSSTTRRTRRASPPRSSCSTAATPAPAAATTSCSAAPTAADSPFLRRPDLLASLVAYWHNHPSLSYLFSGMFIGPTSQHPRVDEARNDSVYELEIAFAELEKQRGQFDPAVAGRPAVPQPADRRHRQHPPRRVLHRQAVLARRPDRAPRPARAARLRDAAARAHVA